MMPEIDISDTWDFGFSATTEDELLRKEKVAANNSRSAADDYKLRLEQLYATVMPLLNNLLKDADEKPHIHWPNRKEKLEEFIATINKIAGK